MLLTGHSHFDHSFDTGTWADLTSARDLLKRGAFRDALDSAKRADGAVDAIIQGYRTVEGRLKEMHRAFAEAESFGVQTVRARKLAEAARRIGARDSDDVPLLALALSLRLPLWTGIEISTALTL